MTLSAAWASPAYAGTVNTLAARAVRAMNWITGLIGCLSRCGSRIILSCSFRRGELLRGPFFEIRYFGRTFDGRDGAIPCNQQRAGDVALPGRVDLEPQAFDKAIAENP